MKIRRINHIAIALVDLESGVRFFGDVFGLHPDEMEDRPTSRLAMIPVGDTAFELLEGKTPSSRASKWVAENGEGLCHVCFEVEDIDAALAELKAKGVKLVDETPRIGHGNYRIAFLDPASTGNVVIELAEPPASGDS